MTYIKTPTNANEIFDSDAETSSQNLQIGRWIKIYPALFEHHFFGREKACRRAAWVDLIGLAAYRQTEVFIGGQMVPLARGQLVGSRSYLAKRWRWGQQQVRTFIAHCLAQQMLAVARHTQNLTILSVCNYDKFQDVQPTINQPSTNHQPESKNRKKLKKIPLPKGKGGQQADPAWAFEAFVSSAEKSGIAKPRGGLTPSRLSQIRQRLGEHGKEGWTDLLATIERSSYIQQGGHDGTWRPTLDWFLKPTNFQKTIEGAYSNGKASGPDINSLDHYDNILKGDRH